MPRMIRFVLPLIPMALLAGCDSGTGMTGMLPNSDPALRKAPTAFVTDAKSRHYEADAPIVTDGSARAQYDLIIKQVDLANITDADWADVEVWINQKYVVYVPHFEAKTDKTLRFNMFCDATGAHFDTGGGANPVKSIEVYRDGKMYSASIHVAE